MPLSAALTGGRPHAKTNTLRIAHGSHAWITASRGWRVKLFPVAEDTAPGPEPPAGVPRAGAGRCERRHAGRRQHRAEARHRHASGDLALPMAERGRGPDRLRLPDPQ